MYLENVFYLDACWTILKNKNSSYVSGLSVCIFVALFVRMCVGANKVEGTMRYYARNQ